MVTSAPPWLSVSEAAARRRSIREYAPDRVSRANLEAILALTSLAPSAFNLQPWRFVVVEDERRRQALAEAARGQRQVAGAPAVIVVYTDMRDALASAEATLHPELTAEQRDRALRSVHRAFADWGDEAREAWGVQQGYIALGYLLLAAAERGYQTSPMLGFDEQQIRTALELPAHVRVVALVAIGHGTEDGRAHHRLPLSRIARFV